MRIFCNRTHLQHRKKTQKPKWNKIKKKHFSSTKKPLRLFSSVSFQRQSKQAEEEKLRRFSVLTYTTLPLQAARVIVKSPKGRNDTRTSGEWKNRRCWMNLDTHEKIKIESRQKKGRNGWRGEDLFHLGLLSNILKGLLNEIYSARRCLRLSQPNIVFRSPLINHPGLPAQLIHVSEVKSAASTAKKFIFVLFSFGVAMDTVFTPKGIFLCSNMYSHGDLRNSEGWKIIVRKNKNPSATR